MAHTGLNNGDGGRNTLSSCKLEMDGPGPPKTSKFSQKGEERRDERKRDERGVGRTGEENWGITLAQRKLWEATSLKTQVASVSTMGRVQV